MSLNPFAADAQIRARIENLAAACGPAVNAAVAERLAARRHAIADNLGGVLLAEEARAIAEKFGLASVEELMLLVLPTAQTMASPPISTFYVGAVGSKRAPAISSSAAMSNFRRPISASPCMARASSSRAPGRAAPP